MTLESRSLPPRPLRSQPARRQLLGGHRRRRACRCGAPGRLICTTEVAIIGGGYTGLSAAYHLAREHGIQAVVLEAGRIGWGASGRNGGFCGLGGSKLGYGVMAQRFGVRPPPSSSRHRRPGWRWSAASPPMRGSTSSPPARASTMWRTRPAAGTAGEPCRHGAAAVRRALAALAQGEMEERLLRSPEAHGCLVVPHYLGLHPLRYVRGLAEAAVRARGAGPCPHPGHRLAARPVAATG